MTHIAHNNVSFGRLHTRANVAEAPKNTAAKSNKSSSSTEEASESASERLAETVKAAAFKHSTRLSQPSSTLATRLLNKLA